jgi:hypothetical protein
MSSMKKFLMWVRVMKLLKITFFGYTYNFHPVILVLFPYSCLLYISHRTYDRYHRTRFLHHVPTVPDHLLPTQVVLRRDQLALKRGIEDEEGANNETGKGDGKPAGKAKAKARAKGKGKGKAKASAKSKGKASETPLADPEPESKVEGEPTAKRAKRTASKGGKKSRLSMKLHQLQPGKQTHRWQSSNLFRILHSQKHPWKPTRHWQRKLMRKNRSSLQSPRPSLEELAHPHVPQTWPTLHQKREHG